MTVIMTPIALLNVESGQAEDAELWDAITEQQLADWEGEWLPELFKSVQKMKRAGVERELWPQSRHWDWRSKTASLQGMLARQGFSVVCDGVTQGMMIVDTTTKRCRQELLNDSPKYRGIGSVLIRTVIELSKKEEFKGRIGLHSLPQSNSFYANSCGMTDLGADPNPVYAPMRYFEMTEGQAEAFIEKGRKP